MALIIYLISILDSIIKLGVISLIISLAAILVICMGSLEVHFEFTPKITNVLRKLVCVIVISICIVVFTPSSKTAAAMYLIPKIAANEDVQAIGENGLKALRELSGQWAEELVEEKNK